MNVAASNCPPDSCIGLFESRFDQIKRPELPLGSSGLLVRAAGFEPTVSWTQTNPGIFLNFFGSV